MKKIPTWLWLVLGGGVFYFVLKGKQATAAAALSVQAKSGSGVTYRDVKSAEQTAADNTNIIEAFVLDLAKRFVALKNVHGNTKYEASRGSWKPLTAENVRETLYASMMRQGGTATLWAQMMPQVETQLAQLR